MRRNPWLSFCLLFVFISTPALGKVKLRDVVTFGDSLTHNDLLYLDSGNPRSMYGHDPMEAVFDKGAGPSCELHNYAIAGSESEHLEYQLDLYEIAHELGRQDTGTLFNVEIGGNDVRNNIDRLSAYAPGANPGADSVITRLIRHIGKGCRRIRDFNPSAQLIIWTVADVTLTPEQFDLTEEQKANVRAHIKRANRYIRKLGRSSLVVVFDLYELSQEFAANPPVIWGNQLVPPPFFGGFDHIYADEVHPTAVTNAIMANNIIERINKKWVDDIPRYTKRELARLAHMRR